MHLKPIPILFVQQHISLSWAEILWGYDHHFISWMDIVEVAKNRLQLNSTEWEFELASLSKESVFRVGELIQKIVDCELEKSNKDLGERWLFLILAWVFQNRDSINDPLGVVENIYADFDYPSEIESFVRYMPASSDYDPSQHSSQDNELRLFKNWEKYLNAYELTR